MPIYKILQNLGKIEGNITRKNFVVQLSKNNRKKVGKLKKSKIRIKFEKKSEKKLLKKIEKSINLENQCKIEKFRTSYLE